jgi:hypothetical protein
VREGDSPPAVAMRSYAAESMVSDVSAREAPGRPALQPAGAARGWNPFFLCLAVLTAASWAVLLVLQSHLIFRLDEWNFLLRRLDWGVEDFLRPHNVHIALAPVSVYKLLLATFGMDSAFPFQVVATLVFLISGVLLFVYLRRRVGDWPALLGSALILFLGAAYIDLLWPFQIGFSGSIAAGLGALLALDRDDQVGDRIACALLAVSISFSELGVPFVAGALVIVLVGERPWIRRLYLAFVPLALYAGWWLGWGHTAKSAFSMDNVLDSPVFVFDAASQTTASLLGLATPLTGSGTRTGSLTVGLNWGRILLVVEIGLGAWRFRRLGRVPLPFWVAVAMGASFWFLTAFNAEAALQEREPTASRYQYPGAVFLLLIAAEIIRGMRVSKRGLVLGSAVTAAAVLSGLWFLHLGYSNNLKPRSDALRAELAAVEIARDRVQPGLVVPAAFNPIVSAVSYLDAADANGSPAYSGSELASSSQAARVSADNLLVQILGIKLGRDHASSSGAGSQSATSCRTVAATPTGVTGLAFQPGQVTLRPRPGASAEVLLGRFADGFPVHLGTLAHGRPSAMKLPADRSPHFWRLGLQGDGKVTVCGRRAPPTPATTTTPIGGLQAVKPGVFVGRIEHIDTYVALVTDGQRLTGANLCFERGGFAWIRPAPLEDGRTELITRSGEILGETSFAGRSARGDVNFAGSSQSFSAKLATGKAGLYRTTSGKPGEAGFSETGWIVLPDGSVCGTTGTVTQSGSKVRPAPSSPKGHVTDFVNPFPFE